MRNGFEMVALEVKAEYLIKKGISSRAEIMRELNIDSNATYKNIIERVKFRLREQTKYANFDDLLMVTWRGIKKRQWDLWEWMATAIDQDKAITVRKYIKELHYLDWRELMIMGFMVQIDSKLVKEPEYSTPTLAYLSYSQSFYEPPVDDAPEAG